MNIHIDERTATGDISLFLDGDLQFDSSDEALYHEALALPALCLAAPADAAIGLRVLICGGGDGLALREVLRFPGVASVDLVDYSHDVVALGRTRLAELNGNAFYDRRVTVHLADAFAFFGTSAEAGYDIILCDFSIPRRSEDARVFTQEWYALAASSLSAGGIIAVNGVSPQRTPEAFWCLEKTIESTGLCTLPFRVCIPSFLSQGYGVWGFFLAAHRSLQRADLNVLTECPVTTAAVDLGRLFDAADFDLAERACKDALRVHTVEIDALMPLMLNPGKQPALIAGAAATANAPLPSLDFLFQAIPTLHPYHTREMVEQLAEQVTGTVRSLDIRKLLDALLARASELGEDIRRELTALRDFIVARGSAAFTFRSFSAWAERLMIALTLLLTLANVVSPDNAFGKGGSGLGHSSVSRGYSAGSFGRSSAGSFGGGRSGYGAGRGRSAPSSFKSTSSVPDAPISGGGFRSGYTHGSPTDIFGTSYSPRTFRYRQYGLNGYGGTDFYIGYQGGSSSGSQSSPQSEPARFVADDDMLVLENGDVVITLSDQAYLLVSQGTVNLFNNADPNPLMALYADPRLFDNIQSRLRDQNVAAAREVKLRRDWLSWVSWTAAFSPAIKSDESELASLVDLERRLTAAETRIGKPQAIPPPDLPDNLATNAVELFVDAGLLADGRTALVGAEGAYYFTDGNILTNGTTNAASTCPPEFASTLRSILLKLQKETIADQGALVNDIASLERDLKTLQSDEAQYTSYRQQYGDSYEVDYGTEEVSTFQALALTEADILQNKEDLASATAERQKDAYSLELIAAALAKLPK